MFEVIESEPPRDWEPIPDAVLDEVGVWDDVVPPPAGLVPMIGDPDDLVWSALGSQLGVQTLPLLTAAPFARLSEQARSLALRRLDELSGHVAAVKAELIGLIAGPAPVHADPGSRAEDFSPHEISIATRCSVYAADIKIAFARDLATRLQATAAAMRDGRITEAQARALSEATCGLDVEIAREIETAMLKYSYRQDQKLFRNALRRWVAKLDPTFTARATAARKDAVVDHRPGTDGTGELYLRGPLEITTAIATALAAYGDATKASLGGTADQRKLAGLRDLIEEYLASPGVPRRHGRLPIITVIIELATLLNLRAGIAHIPGVGEIPAIVAQQLLADGAPLRRLVIDPLTGKALDYGTTTYQVPPALADLLIATNPTSAGPHSTIDSAGADMEHDLPHDAGGPTNPINVTPIDRRWHRAKTHGGYRYEKDPDTGIITWTSPTGLTCQIDPYDYRDV